jgi:hypothetical protein
MSFAPCCRSREHDDRALGVKPEPGEFAAMVMNPRLLRGAAAG